jgi:cytoskeletal protein RodZ
MQENNPEKLAAEEAAREQEKREEAARNPQRNYAASTPADTQRTARRAVEPPTGNSFATGDDFRQRVQRAHRRQNMVLALVVCVVVGAGAFFLLSSDDQSAPAPAKQTTTAAKTPAKAAPQPAQTASAKQFDDVEVKAVFTDRCWTSVKADGKTLYEGTVEKGETKEWKANDKISITAGNAGAVSFTVNGKDMGKAGQNGQVEEKTFTKETQN